MFLTSTKLILERFFANGTWNKIVQNPKNKIVKKISFGYIHNWGTQKECFTPKSLSKHYFEWPIYEIIY
jgi:hypothetical protein